MLGEKWVTKMSGQQAGQLVRKEDKFVYVPIIETLEMLLKIEPLSTEINFVYPIANSQICIHRCYHHTTHQMVFLEMSVMDNREANSPFQKMAFFKSWHTGMKWKLVTH